MGGVAIECVDNYRLGPVGEALSRAFAALGWDGDVPLAGTVRPGDTVFVKPNWVASRWRASAPHVDTLWCVITHTSVIEAVCDAVAAALQGRGRIIVGDNPSIDADFAELLDFTGVERLRHKYDVPVEILDLRPLVCDDLANYGDRDLMVEQAGDPAGKVVVNLGRESMLYGLDPARFRGVFDQRDETVASHTGETQLYTYARSLYDADVYVSVPKLKTHQKVGATLNLKGLVGTISNKNQLVHWQVGYPETGGDEYPSREAWEAGQVAKVTHRGSWPGNDTIWRMVVDLWRGMQRRERRYLSVVDGVIAGEGQGPFCPTAKFANSIVVGPDLLDVDLVAARWMGLDPTRIAYLRHLAGESLDGLDRAVEVSVGGDEVGSFFARPDRYKDFAVVGQWDGIRFGNGNV